MTQHTGTTLKAVKLGCAFLALIYLGCDGSSAEAKKAKHLERAEAYLTKGQYQEAVIEYRNVTQLDAKDADAHYQLALAYLKLGGLPNLQAAFAELTRTVELDKANQEAQLKLGELYLLGNEPGKARERAEVVLVSAPQNTDGLILKGRSLAGEKRYKESIEDLKSAIAADPNRMQRRASELRSKLNQAPQSPLLHNLLGQLWAHDKQYAQAEQAFRKAIELNDALFPAYLNLAGLYLQTDKQDQAIKEYEAVLAKNANAIQAHMMLGMIHEGRNEIDKAQARYETILKLNPRFVPAANNLAWILAERGGNLDVALAHAQTAWEGNPEDPRIADTLGWVYYKKNAYLLAVNLLKEAAEKLPNEPAVHYHYGMALAKNNNPTEAKKALETALKLNPRFDGAEEARTTLEKL